jgi:multicomponent Na+:H+ antiporter subunit E
VDLTREFSLLRAVGLGGVLYGFWLLLSGHYTPLLLGLGVASTVLVVYLCARMGAVDEEGAPFHLTGRLALYIPWLMKEILVSNVAVARIILDPALPIDPALGRFRASQETEIGRMIHAQSITLTPGTITTGVNGKDFELHALVAAELTGREEAEMDRRCTVLERGS